jgi:hypothetical protein
MSRPADQISHAQEATATHSDGMNGRNLRSESSRAQRGSLSEVGCMLG